MLQFMFIHKKKKKDRCFNKETKASLDIGIKKNKKIQITNTSKILITLLTAVFQDNHWIKNQPLYLLSSRLCDM